MSTVADLEGKSLEDIIKSNKHARQPKKPQQKGPARREEKRRDSPYSSSSRDSWKHDKFDSAVRKQKPVREPAPQKTEEELGFKVKVSNSPLTDDEYKALLEGSELKFVRSFAAKKTASLFFSTKADADKSVADFNNTELLDGAGPSVWEYVPWAPREPRPAREPRERREPREPREPRESQGRPQKQFNKPRNGGNQSGGRINPRDVVITVRK